jgi:hypothetical protein
MNEIIWKTLVRNAVPLNFSYFKNIVVLFSVLVVLTSGVLWGQEKVKDKNQAIPDELPAIQAKPKLGLLKIHNVINYGLSSYNLIGHGGMAFDDAYAYVATPNGLFRTVLPLVPSSSFELIGFQNTAIADIYVHNNKLYVLKASEPTQGSEATDHTFLKSESRGATFVPIDQGLQYCVDGYCQFLEARQAIFKGNLIFLAAGGANFFVTGNEGANWIPLLGDFMPVVCGETYELVNNRLLYGGECPLDVAYLRGISLRPDLLALLPPAEQPPPAVPNLGNRNVIVIKHKPNSPDVYAGVEGGLLKSGDGGQNFRYVIKYSSGSSRYPYISKIFTYSRNPNLIVAGGADKALNRLLLLYSKDNGETWFDVSSKIQELLGGSSFPLNDETFFITEDSQGRVFVGITHPRTKNLFIIQFRIDVAAFR